ERRRRDRDSVDLGDALDRRDDDVLDGDDLRAGALPEQPQRRRRDRRLAGRRYHRLLGNAQRAEPRRRLADRELRPAGGERHLQADDRELTMTRLRIAVSRRMREERGFTLVEMTIALMLMLVVTVIFITVMVSVQGAVAKDQGRSVSNDQARLAVEELDREIRSGNVLYDPSLENDPGNGIYPNMSLRIYTQSNADTRNPGNQCVQWRILNDELQRRSWGVDWP